MRREVSEWENEKEMTLDQRCLKGCARWKSLSKTYEDTAKVARGIRVPGFADQEWMGIKIMLFKCNGVNMEILAAGNARRIFEFVECVRTFSAGRLAKALMQE